MKKTDYILFFLKGVLMGGCDIVPGVSGGTIAFITGIYDRLLNALQSIKPSLFTLWKYKGLSACWKKIDGFFLLSLFSGILLSVFILSHVISYLLQEYPIFVWSFFFGLILISSLSMIKQVKKRTIKSHLAFLIAIIIAYQIGTLPQQALPETSIVIFFAGMVAICAMILPGISGSFLLLLMGLYTTILQAVKSLNFLTLFTFAGGCLVGLLVFSHILSWCLSKYRDITISILTGLMLGSLGKVWPWKQVLTERLNSAGETVPLLQINITPIDYQQLTGQPSYLWMAILFGLIATGLYLSMEWIGKKIKNN